MRCTEPGVDFTELLIRVDPNDWSHGSVPERHIELEGYCVTVQRFSLTGLSLKGFSGSVYIPKNTIPKSSADHSEYGMRRPTSSGLGRV